ncbi:tyrosine-type recombinase/integrase [Microcoleus vaginatus GB1-A2]
MLRMACKNIGLEGVSTHSFRRTALTQMSDACIPLRVIAKISGHQDLSQLHAYLEVRPEQVRGAIASLSGLSYIGNVLVPLTCLFPSVELRWLCHSL